MNNDVIKKISMILDEGDNVVLEIRNDVYRILKINTHSDALEQYIMQCIEQFSFNTDEKKILGEN